MNCYCGSELSYSDCCELYITGQQKAPSPQALMRSRYSAYCNHNWQYILTTYGEIQRRSLSVIDLQESANNTHWLRLEIINSSPYSNAGNNNSVEFKAYYWFNQKPHLLHETSQFEYQNNNWCYTTGTIHDDSGQIKLGRNELCICGSGKKFKQCCMTNR